jgi:uncharacterized protein with von Willebrand factor type A (vWA) domain
LDRLRASVKFVYWVTPEPEADWMTGDCSLERYRRHCDRIDQVSTLGQLHEWVDSIVLGS